MTFSAKEGGGREGGARGWNSVATSPVSCTKYPASDHGLCALLELLPCHICDFNSQETAGTFITKICEEIYMPEHLS